MTQRCGHSEIRARVCVCSSRLSKSVKPYALNCAFAIDCFFSIEL